MDDQNFRAEKKDEILRMSAGIVSAYVSRNSISSGDISEVVSTVFSTLMNLSESGPVSAEPLKPAVSLKKSITPDYLICLEDGKKLKMLKRHLRTAYGLTPEEYRAKWGLPADYPMVAPSYAEQRSDFAKKIGLGRGSKGRGK